MWLNRLRKSKHGDDLLTRSALRWTCPLFATRKEGLQNKFPLSTEGEERDDERSDVRVSNRRQASRKDRYVSF
jgi:hypothetical protein